MPFNNSASLNNKYTFLFNPSLHSSGLPTANTAAAVRSVAGKAQLTGEAVTGVPCEASALAQQSERLVFLKAQGGRKAQPCPIFGSLWEAHTG